MATPTTLPPGGTPAPPRGPAKEAPVSPTPGQTPATSGSDWQHLLIRIAEFSLGAGLIWVGIAALLSRTKPVKATVHLVTGVAGGQVRTAQAVRRARATEYARQQVKGGNGG